MGPVLLYLRHATLASRDTTDYVSHGYDLGSVTLGTASARMYQEIADIQVQIWILDYPLRHDADVPSSSMAHLYGTIDASRDDRDPPPPRHKSSVEEKGIT